MHYTPRDKRERIDRWEKLKPKTKKIYFFRSKIWKNWGHTFNPICQGCRKELKPGEEVYEFRTDDFTHTSLDCIKRINPLPLDG